MFKCMKYKIIAVGKIKDNYFREAIAEYIKRISRFANVEMIEVDEYTFLGVPNQAEITKIVDTEGQKLLQKAEGFVVALDIEGQLLSSVELAERLQKSEQSFSVVSFIIGGSYGLSPAVKSCANLRLSFGRITLPHQLCRVVLCEQIYRVCSIRNNVPYHK